MFMGCCCFGFFYIAFLALKIEKNQLEVMSAKFMVIKWVTYKTRFGILKKEVKKKKLIICTMDSKTLSTKCEDGSRFQDQMKSRPLGHIFGDRECCQV